MDTNELNLSISAFAKQVNRSRTQIQRLLASGVIPRNADGTIPAREGLEAFRQYQFRVKDPKGARLAKGSPTTDMIGVNTVDDADGEAIKDNVLFNKAKAQEKVFAAKLKQLEVQQKTGVLFLKEDIEADAQRVATEVRGALFSIPPRVSALCEGRTAREIQRIIEDAINDALEGLQKGRFANGKD